MIKVLLDTSVLISSFPDKRVNDPERNVKAQCITQFLEKSDNFMVCYSERTERELKNDRHFKRLKRYTRLNSHILNQTIDKSDVIMSNCGTVINDYTEAKFGDELEELLPDKSSKPNKNDRGIYGDAVYEGCSFIIHENPKDFNRLHKHTSGGEIIVIDLLNHTCTEVIQMLNQSLDAV